MNSSPLSDIRSAKIEQACNDNFMDSNTIAHMPEISAKPFQCEGCDKSYMREGSLRKHRWMKHMIKPFQCLTCNKSYILERTLRAHHEAAHTDSTFDCGRCNEKLPYVSSLAYHLAMFSGRRLPKAWPCSSCNKAYDKFCFYNRHFLAVHAKHAYCSGCMEVDMHNADYREHSTTQEFKCGGKHVTFLCRCCYHFFRVCAEPWKLSSRGERVIFPCFLCSFYGTSPLAIYEHRGRAHMVCKSCRD